MTPTTFAELGVSPAVARALATREITAPFAVQRSVLPDALEGHDVLVRSPTGSGKTLAFALPLVERLERNGAPRPAGLVLAPTRELALQIVDDLQPLAAASGLTVAAVYGGVGLERQAKIARRAHIIVATPGRLLDLLARGAFALGKVRMLVLDEADRMLDMGFKPDVDRIVGLTPADRQTMLFSATLDGEVARIAAAYTRDARRHEQAAPVHKQAQVEHRFVPVAHEDKVDALVAELDSDERGRTLVFVRTKRGADRLVKRLGSHAVDAVAMHGDKTQGQRERALAQFDSGRVDVLVATDVAARGIDVEDVTHVINYDAPEDREGYVHRIGRTGRAGRTGTGVTFVMHDQARDVGKIAAELRLDSEFASTGLVVPRAAAPARTSRSRSGRPRARR
jgi:superfamily II DNA/RNA helicase